MEPKITGKPPLPGSVLVIRFIICLVILGIGIMGMIGLKRLKKPPIETDVEEKSIKVNTIKAVKEQFPVFINGYGEVKALDVVNISPEVSGKIAVIHPRLEAGEVIEKGETLFKIESQSYLASLKEAGASVQLWETSILRLKKQYAFDVKREKTLQRNRNLAKSEYERVKGLFEKSKIGTRSGVEKAEQAFNSASDMADQMAQSVDLYPIRIKEAQSSLVSANARKEMAEINFKKCSVSAPFKGRIKEVALEKNQFISPGYRALILANDATLEILVPIDSRDARKWLKFSNNPHGHSKTWFSGLEQVTCKVQWTEGVKDKFWAGYLHRIVRFNQQTRTLTLAVRVDSESVSNEKKPSLPLVEGMFCTVKIPGKPLSNVIRVPRWAVSFDNTVYISTSELRLKTVPVKVARMEGEYAYIENGLNPGDTIITTRLIDPIENSLLEILNTNS